MAIPPPLPNGTHSEPPPEAEAGPSTAPRYHLSQTLSAHSRAVTALRFSNDGETLVSAGADGYLHFWNAESGECIRGFRAHKTGINDISISPDSLYLTTASDDCTSLLFPLYPPPSPADEPLPLKTFTGHTAPVLSISFSPKSNLLVTGSFDESAIIWDVRRGKVLRNLPAHADAVWCVCWDAEGAMVMTGSGDGLIRLWDVSSGQCLKTLDNDTNSPVSYASFTPSSYFLLSSTLSSTLRIYNIHTSKVLKTIQAPGVYISEKYPCPAIIFEAPDLPSGKEDGMEIDGNSNIDVKGPANPALIVAGSENGKIVIWDLQSKNVCQVLQGHLNTVVAVAVHPNGRIIVSGSLEPERSVKLWRTN
ncbi:hypothetical protein I302_100692 [Kwoniella bestiolae CBS 10118]|uniref:WDR5-like beta-propeller domain-containing protein n=1 Tax=Kwoniella bestiolae CBS 10118 TaxID=1296100 RepID=A0A1B9G5S7_9TREE|nr:hypothetical protein I302_04068 [Kwoniella bestiolae CBS 10118]OCF26385.1 hypothetical protein I302_04068 [Kwoniella bestiolae CBS 10118]